MHPLPKPKRQNLIARWVLRVAALGWLIALVSTPALAAPSVPAPLLGALFGDHAVLQRDRPIPVWGRAKPGDVVTIQFAGGTTETRADGNGDWHVRLPAVGPGGPYVLRATSSSGATQEATDVLVGDVLLCAGQSNMELPVKQALNAANEMAASADTGLRLVTIPSRTALERADSLLTPVQWSAAKAATVADFSAACYFMARELRTLRSVPLGLIQSTWGGTQINAWRSAAAVTRDAGVTPQVALFAAYRRNPAAGIAQIGRTWEAWWAANVGTPAERAPWRDPGPETSWSPVPSFSNWQSWPDPTLHSYRGVVWYRADIVLTRSQLKKSAATLVLGRVSRQDRAWINGTTIGGDFGERERRYSIKPGLLRPGVNRVMVAVSNGYDHFGLIGGSAFQGIAFADGTTVAPTVWRYRRSAATLEAVPPQVPWLPQSGIAVLYNAMIAPLRDYGLAGVAWYQGEQDRNDAKGYQLRLAGLMAEWRAQFQRPDLPFVIAQISTFGRRTTTPDESSAAVVREEQRRAVAADSHAALAVTIDLGEPNDIHPANKQDVGLRLARAARVMLYDEQIASSGPQARSAQRVGDTVEIRFVDVTDRLMTLGGAHALGFQLCGDGRDSCRWADPTVAGSVATIGSAGTPASRIRFCWGDTPVCNVVDGSGLPAGPFELPITP